MTDDVLDNTPMILVRWRAWFGRMGDLDGVFVTRQNDIDSAIGKEAHFGEVLGKHSNIECVLTEGMFKVLSEDQEFIAKLVDIAGVDVCGFNPLYYINREEDEEDDDGYC